MNAGFRRGFLHTFGANLGARLHEERSALLGEETVNAEVERYRARGARRDRGGLT
ncbi:hypothetical protein ABT024_32325 [Streptomyces sp. NPDC002812]|uniref:hypothetical protein n=1 Tax=Streptomyces sp. NPDC002812 TaxID=3154434 RepID=UPI00332422B8